MEFNIIIPIRSKSKVSKIKILLISKNINLTNLSKIDWNQTN